MITSLIQVAPLPKVEFHWMMARSSYVILVEQLSYSTPEKHKAPHISVGCTSLKKLIGHWSVFSLSIMAF